MNLYLTFLAKVNGNKQTKNIFWGSCLNPCLFVAEDGNSNQTSMYGVGWEA